MNTPTKITINLSALEHNLKYIKSLTESKIVGVVKSNAYGHGLVTIAKVLEKQNIDMLAVARIEEAISLREHNIQRPILLLEGILAPEELSIANKLNLSIVIYCTEQIEWLMKSTENISINVWLKMNSGMNRIGFSSDEFKTAYFSLKKLGTVASITFMTHFSSADDLSSTYTETQLINFDKAIKFCGHEQKSLCNSAAFFRYPKTHANWVRVGLSLYGISPFAANGGNTKTDKLVPIMQVTSKIIAINHLPAHAPIGYNQTFITPKPSRIGVVAIGYGDGYSRQLSNKSVVMINGQCAQIVGNISMDMTTVDLTDLPHVKIGDSVELWGEHLNLSKVTENSGLIPYELLCNIAPRSKHIDCIYEN